MNTFADLDRAARQDPEDADAKTRARLEAERQGLAQRENCRHDRILVECLRDRLELLEGDSALYGDPIDPRAALAALEGEVLEINRRLGDEGPNSWTRLSLEVRSRHIAAALAEQE